MMPPHPNQHAGSRDREEQLFAKLCDLAREGKPLPRIPDFGPMLGIAGHGSVYNILDRLERAGRIAVEGMGPKKVVFIPSLDLRVASSTNPQGRLRRPIADIVALVARVACLPVDELMGPRRTRLEVRPRYAAIRLARQEGWSFGDIGRAMGRDHTTVIHAWHATDEMLPRDKLFARLLRRAEAEMTGIPEPAFTIKLRRASPPLRAVTSRHPIEINEDDRGEVQDMRSRRAGADRLLAAIRRAHPERCAA